MRKLIITILVAVFVGLIQSAYFSLSAASITSIVFSYILLASILTGYVVYLLFKNTSDLLLAAGGSIVLGAVIYNISALLFDQSHLLELLEPLMTLGAGTGVICLLVQILTSTGKMGMVKNAENQVS